MMVSYSSGKPKSTASYASGSLAYNLYVANLCRVIVQDDEESLCYDSEGKLLEDIEDGKEAIDLSDQVLDE